MAEIQANLPKDRVFELYLGTKSIMDSVAGLMQMAGGEATFVAPANVSPIAIAGTAGKGGMAMHLFLTADVIKAMSEIRTQMDAAGGGDEEPVEAGDKKGEPATPRF